MPVPDDVVREIAGLARLRLSDAEASSMASDLNEILDFVDVLGEAPEPLVEARPATGELRPDEPGETLTREEALANAPASDGALFAVPRFLPDETL